MSFKDVLALETSIRQGRFYVRHGRVCIKRILLACFTGRRCIKLIRRGVLGQSRPYSRLKCLCRKGFSGRLSNFKIDTNHRVEPVRRERSSC